MDEKKYTKIGIMGHAASYGIGVAIAALRDAGHNVVIIDGEDADALEQMKQAVKAREARLRAETLIIDNMSVALTPRTELPYIVDVKSHEVKYKVTRKSVHNQKKRRK